MFSLKTHAIISASLFAAMVLMAVGGNALVSFGAVARPDKPNLPLIMVFFGLFLAFAFSFVPVMVMTVMKGQAALGNTGRSELVRELAARQRMIIWVIWGIMLLGTLIAVPAAIANGMFSG